MGDMQFNGTPEEWEALVKKNKQITMAQYRKKPVVIEAVQWFQNGDVPQANTHPIDSDTEWVCKQCGQIASKHNNCPTLEGFHIVCPGDYIIKGVKGEYYPCKPDIFEMTYDKIDESALGINK